MRRLPLVLFSVLWVLAFAGCGDDGGSPAAPTPGGGADVADPNEGSGDEGNGDAGGSVVIPSDFAIPTLDGAEVVIDSLPGIPEGAYLQLLYPGDRLAEIVGFYETWVGGQTAEWSETPDDTSNGAGWFSLALEGEPGYGQSVLVAPPTGGDGRVSVTLVAELVDG